MPTEISEWIAARRAEYETATPGPWERPFDYGYHWSIGVHVPREGGVHVQVANAVNKGDAVHIVSAHNAYGAMLVALAAAAGIPECYGAERHLVGSCPSCDLHRALDALTETGETRG